MGRTTGGQSSGHAQPAEADAVVLVGGQGTRLRPLTLSAAKPMLPTAGVPFLAHLLSRIGAAGMRHVILGTSYRAETFEEYFGTGEAFGLDLDYAVEEEPLGTGGAIGNVSPLLRHGTAVVFNGDILSGADLPSLLATHREVAADVTLHLVRVSDPRRFGSVPTDDAGRVTAFVEKSDNPPTDQINAGCYVFQREVIDTIPRGRPVSVERETFPSLLDSGAHIHGYVDESYWLDMGTPESFVRGSADLVQGIAPTYALPGRPGVALVLPGAAVDPTAILDGGATVGAGASVGAGARIDGAVIGDGAQIHDRAQVTDSIVGAGAVIGADAIVTNAVIGDRARVGERCELIAGIRVWPDTVLAAGSVRFSADA